MNNPCAPDHDSSGASAAHLNPSHAKKATGSTGRKPSGSSSTKGSGSAC